jgi:chitodextrinase
MAVVRYRAVQPAEEDTGPTQARYAILGVGIFVVAAVALVVGLTGGQENRAQPQPLIPDLFPHTPMTHTQPTSTTPSGTETSSPVPTTTTTVSSTTITARRTTATANRPPTPPPSPPPTFVRSGPRAPQARIKHSCTGLTCTFDASDSTAREGTLVYYGWSFGDGSNATAMNATHTYRTGGTYQISLVVMDDAGRVDYASIQLSPGG